MMATVSKSTITLLACVLSLGLAQSARAQTAPPPSPRHAGHEVHDGDHAQGDFLAKLTIALNLTADQQARVKVIFEDTLAQARAITDSTTLSGDDKREKMRELHEAAGTKVKAFLTPEQQSKFDELHKQLAHDGPGHMGDPVAMLTTALNLTPDQQSQAKAIFEAMHPQMESVEADTTLSEDEKATRLQALRDATHGKIKALLTPDQQQKFEEILKQHHD